MGFFVVISLVLVAGSFFASWWARRLAADTRAIQLAHEIPLAQLSDDAASVAREMGAGSFREMVRIHGKMVCDHPLVAELSHTPCVSYRYSVTREFEEVLWERDFKGNSARRVVRRSEVVASNQATTPFWLDDGTARILVQPNLADVDLVKTHSSFQPVDTSGTAQRVGSFFLDVGPPAGGTLGYRYEEFSLPLDQEVTVVAEAGDFGGTLELRRPEVQGAPFLVTTIDRRDLFRKDQKFASVLNGVSIGLAAVAVLIFLLGVVH